jgi:hypothetical protein
MKTACYILIPLLLSACSEYWWTRGQPPASAEILVRAQERVLEMRDSYPSERPEIQALADVLSTEFQILTADDISSDRLHQSFQKIEESLISLEGILSYGNRPPLQELSGQFRALKERGVTSGFDNLPKESLRLFGARVLFMLSSEIKVPAPDAVIAS